MTEPAADALNEITTSTTEPRAEAALEAPATAGPSIRIVEPKPAEPATAEVPAEDAKASPVRTVPGIPRRALALAGAVAVLALGLGWGLGTMTVPAREAATPAWAAGLAQGLVRAQEDVVRLTGDVRAVKAALETAGRPQGAPSLIPVLERLDRAERGRAESVQQMALLAERLERIEKAAGGPRLDPVVERLDRIEKQVGGAALQIASLQQARPEPQKVDASKAEPQQTAALPEKKPEPRTQALEGWVLRDVYDGLALIEGSNKRLLEVSPGAALPGGVRIESIERRGKGWVVLTSKGVIGMERWW